MKIVMLGHSGVGKTTFMACMYAMLQEEVGGFSVLAADESTHERLINMAIAVLEGKYPAATTHRSSYELVLLYNNEAFFGFEWVDYRGNALNESGSHSDMRELQSSLDEADGIIAFFDGVALTRGGRGAWEAVGRLMVLLQQAINAENRIIPVALVITKADLLTGFEKALEAVKPLAEAIAQSKTVHGALIFTACGKGIAASVQMPTLFVLHKGLNGALAQMSSVIEAKQESARRNADDAWAIPILLGISDSWDAAQREIAEANALIARFNELVEPANALHSMLTDILMF